MSSRQLSEILDKQKGVLKLQPTYVRRFYMDGGRLAGGKPGSTFIKKDGLWKPERWIASGTVAVNVHPIPNEGLSKLAGSKLTLVDAFRAAGDRLLGPKRFNAHGPEFRVLIKILDGHTPIVFHFHADDAAVKKYPKHFAGHRFGKDEAYFFLDRPKSKCPYTHVGLYPGTSADDLIKAMKQGSERTLELSPSFYQKTGEGFFVPAGIVHRPGSALTLEIQQPSDVYTLLEDRMEETRFSPEQMHPGFKSLKEAFKFIDFKASNDENILDKYRLVPKPTGKSAMEDWIFPPDICRKFSGKCLRVTSRRTITEPDCFAVLVWKGKGKLGPHVFRAGDEFFVSHEAAVKGIEITSQGSEPLELFTFFGAPTH